MMTPYACAKVVNEKLKEAGIKKQLPPQMFYSYTTGRLRKGLRPLIECDEKGRVSIEDLDAWFEKYLAKNV